MNVREGKIVYSVLALLFFIIIVALIYFLPNIIKPVHNIIIERVECAAIIAFIIIGAVIAIIWGIILIEDTNHEGKVRNIKVRRVTLKSLKKSR